MVAESKPNPDPTEATNAAREQAVLNTKEYINSQIEILNERYKGATDVIVQRLDGMDEANKVLHETVTRVPTDMQLAVGHLEAVVGERFKSVEKQFSERDDRSKSEGVANEVKVNAAFAAQEKLAVQQNLNNQTNIDKSEKNTNETIKQIVEAAKISSQAQAVQIADLKDRLTKIESFRIGGQETNETWKWAIGFGIGLILTAITIVGFIIANKPN